MRIISPSILSADFTQLRQEIEILEGSRAEWIHFDVMDGVFVNNISFGFPILRSVRSLSKKFLDVHLMIVEPQKYIERFSECGADMITLHVESTDRMGECLSRIHALKKKAGITLRPSTPLEKIIPYLHDVDMVLLMSVEPGFGGQKFITDSLERVRSVRRELQKVCSNALIEIDGGVTLDNVGTIFQSGVDVVVAGSAVFSSEEPQKQIERMLEI